MEKILVLLKEIVSFVKIYGVDGVYWLIVLAYIVGVIYPEFSHEVISSSNIVVLGIIWLGTKLIKSTEVKREGHHKQSQNRLESNYTTKTELLKLKYEAQADRAFVLEYHNGKENPTLLPFIYLDMTFEETGSVPKYVSDEYQNLNVSLFDFPQYLAEKNVFVGTIDEFEKIDIKIAHRMRDNGIKYVGAISLKNNGILIGILGVSYEDSEPNISKEDIQTKLAVYAQDISDYLDLRKYEKKNK